MLIYQILLIIDCIVENYGPIRIINGDGAEVIDYSQGTTVKEPTLSLRYVGKAILDLTKILSISKNLKNYFFNEDIDMSEFSNLTSLFENLW